MKPAEYWVRDKGNGYSDVVTENCVLIDLDNEYMIPALIELSPQYAIVHLPDRPLSHEPGWWKKLMGWLTSL